MVQLEGAEDVFQPQKSVRGHPVKETTTTMFRRRFPLVPEKATDSGILVPRINFTTFIGTLSPDTPFGLAREIDLL